MSESTVALRLADLRRFGSEAAYIVAQGREGYTADSPYGAMLRNAGERILIKVATVVEKFPESYKAGHERIRWVAIARMRNLIAHHYDKINDDLVWEALRLEVPALLVALGLDD